MLHVRARRSFIFQFDPFSVLVFHTAIFLFFMHSSKGQPDVIGPPQSVVALIGDDIILPCNLNPVMNAFDTTVEWARPDLDPRFVLVWRDGVELESKKHPSYNKRTSLFTQELQNGNMSLKISSVKLSDEGTYRCYVPQFDRYATVQLVVGAAPSPVAEINRNISTVALQCESAGWYPEPELSWLDSEGNLLSAGPTEILRGPDGLYTVSSRVTVEKRQGNSFTCRVQEKNINQTRETDIHVPDEFFMVISPSSPPSEPTSSPNIIIGLVIGAVVFVLILGVFILWKWRRSKLKNKEKNEEDGSEQNKEEKKITSKSADSGFQVVVKGGESEPLMRGREEENEVNRRGEGTNTSAITDKEPQFEMKQETHEEQEITGTEEKIYVDSRGEQNKIDERETQQDQFVLGAEKMRDMSSSQEKSTDPPIVTEKESLLTTEQETYKEEDMTGSGVKAKGSEGKGEKMVEAVKEDSGRQVSPITDGHKEQPVLVREAESFTFTLNLNTDQEPQRERETQNQQLMEDRQTAIKQPNVKKKSATNKNKMRRMKESSKVMTQKEEQENKREQLMAEQQREENQRKLQSETRSECEKDETKFRNQKKDTQDGGEENKQEISEAEADKEKRKDQERNQRDSVGERDRKAEEQRDQKENRISSVSSNVTEKTDVKVQETPRGKIQKKQPEEKSQKNKEEIREQPEKLRKAESKEGIQGEVMEKDEAVRTDETHRNVKQREKFQLRQKGRLQEEQQLDVNKELFREQLEDCVSLTERGFYCQDQLKEEEPMEIDQTSDVSQKTFKRRKFTQEVHDDQEQLTYRKRKRVENNGAQTGTSKNPQYDDVTFLTNREQARTSQLDITIKRHNYQHRLPVSNDPQACLEENHEEPMEVNMENDATDGLTKKRVKL